MSPDSNTSSRGNPNLENVYERASDDHHWKKVIQKVEAFFFAPSSPRPLACLRIGLSALLLTQAYLLRGAAYEMLSSKGFVQGDLIQVLSIEYTPKIAGLVYLLSPFHITEATCIAGVCLAYLASLVCLLFGFGTRISAVATWFLHWTLMSTSNSTTYGIDLYAHVFLFYLIWAPSGAMYSVDALLKKQINPASSWATLSLRVFQLHLCVTYFFSAVEKAQGIQWWNGELLWRALMLPQYYQFDMTWLAQWPVLSKVAGWMTLLFEGAYFIFIWPKITRMVWVAGMVALHLGIAIFLGLDLFGAIMCILTFCIFGISNEVKPRLRLVKEAYLSDLKTEP